MTMITRRRLAQFAGSSLAMPAIARAAGSRLEISFYFPVAVGGPITKNHRQLRSRLPA